MRNPNYSTVDPKTGSVSYSGPLEITKGDHSNMPARTDAYLPGYERGHVTASQFGGTNSSENIVPQHSDLNHGAYYSMEQGERVGLQSGASIHSDKTAVVNGQMGDRPEAFMVSDVVTYNDGHTESIHHSFTNEPYADQAAWNVQSASLPGTFDESNPGDGLRDSMNAESYAELMESTDAELPGIAEDYAPADFSGMPIADSAADFSAASDVGNADTDASADSNADAGADVGSDPD